MWAVESRPYYPQFWATWKRKTEMCLSMLVNYDRLVIQYYLLQVSVKVLQIDL